jgi:hypothetical protein
VPCHGASSSMNLWNWTILRYSVTPLRSVTRRGSNLHMAGGVAGGLLHKGWSSFTLSLTLLLKVGHDHNCKPRIFSRSPGFPKWSYKACTTNGKQSKVKTEGDSQLKLESSKSMKICSVLLLGLCSGTRITRGRTSRQFFQNLGLVTKPNPPWSTPCLAGPRFDAVSQFQMAL